MYSILTLYNWWSIVNCNRYGSRKYLLIEAHLDEQTSELSGERSWIWCGLVFFVFRLTSSCLAFFSYFQCIQYVISSSSSTAFSLFRFFFFFFFFLTVICCCFFSIYLCKLHRHCGWKLHHTVKHLYTAVAGLHWYIWSLKGKSI